MEDIAMKKNYQKPNTELIQLNIENLMGVNLSNGKVKSVSGGSNYEGNESGVLSRQVIFYDDASSDSGSIWDE